ncbi:MAG: alpha,6-mannosyltransferase [Alphaproteobacteria bacterium]|nr:alpha,6-mannosyltransferase [Alphaproteobacteria bacterium]
MQTSGVRFRVNLLGAAAVTAYFFIALLSYVQAPALWRSQHAPQLIAFFDTLAERFPVLALHRLFEGSGPVLVSYFVPLAVVTAAAIMLLLMLPRYHRQLDEAIVTLLLRWSVAFAAVCFFAFPLFTQDFWLSVAWGRMVADGLNPFHTLFTSEMITGLPLDHFPMLMSYGPAWALLSGAVMVLAGDSLLAAAILFKLILLAAWVGALVLVGRIMAPRPVIDRCLAIVLFGWMPLGVQQSVAEGHNDIAMVVLALLWLHLLLSGRWTAPFALMASALAKFVTGPLFLVDAIVAWRLHRLSFRALLVRYALPGLLGLAVLAVFYRSTEFFDGTRVISEWHFLQPRDALAAIDLTFGLSLEPADLVIMAAFVVLAVHSLVMLFRQPTPDGVIKAALAVMSAITFAIIAHIWPWYLVWTAALAALLPGWWLSRFVIGVTIVAPFTLVAWWVPLFAYSTHWAALVMYVAALLWTAFTRVPAEAESSERSARDVGSRSAIPES